MEKHIESSSIELGNGVDYQASVEAFVPVVPERIGVVEWAKRLGDAAVSMTRVVLTGKLD